jgi:hypothetical protein
MKNFKITLFLLVLLLPLTLSLSVNLAIGTHREYNLTCRDSIGNVHVRETGVTEVKVSNNGKRVTFLRRDGDQVYLAGMLCEIVRSERKIVKVSD